MLLCTKKFSIHYVEPGVVAHICNPSAQEAEARESGVKSQPGQTKRGRI